MDVQDVCRVPGTWDDGKPPEQASGKPGAGEAHLTAEGSHSGGGVSAGGSIFHSGPGGVAAGASISTGSAGSVSSGHKGGGKDEAPAAAAGGAASSSGKSEMALSGSLAKAKLQDSLGQGDAGGKTEGGGIGAAAGAFGKFQPGGGVEAAAGSAPEGKETYGKIEGGGIGAAAGAFGKFQPGGGIQGEMGKIDSGMKFEGQLDGGGLGAGAGAAGMMGKIEDAVKFGEGFKDIPGGGLPGGDKFGGAGSLGGKLAGMGEGGPEGGKFDKGGLGGGKDPAWKQDGSSAGDGVGKKDDGWGVGSGKKDDTGNVGTGKKDDAGKTGGSDDKKKTEGSDSGQKTESKTTEKKDTGGTKETEGKEKEKKDAKGMSGGGPGDPNGFDGHGNADPLGFLPRREKNPMPTGEEVGVHHGEGDRGRSNRFSTQGSIHARIQPGGGRDGEYETRAEGPSLLWELQHYGIDRPETGAVESEAGMSVQSRAGASSDGQSGATGPVAGRVRAEARAEGLAAEELPGGGQIPPGAGD